MIKNPTYKFYQYNHKRADGTECVRIAAVSSFAGKPVKGYADCHPNDAFDVEYGQELAAARCAEKIAGTLEVLCNENIIKNSHALPKPDILEGS